MGGTGKQHRSSTTSTSKNEKHPDLKRRNTQEVEQSSPGASGKRRRVTRACDQCRQGREKCDGAQPCHSCQKTQRQCSYKGASKRRGVQPGYIRALEGLVAWSLNNFEDAETKFRNLLAREPITDELGLLSKDPTISEDLSHAWLESQVHKDLEAILDGKPASASNHKRSEFEHAITSDSTRTRTRTNEAVIGDNYYPPQADIDMLSPASPPIAGVSSVSAIRNFGGDIPISSYPYELSDLIAGSRTGLVPQAIAQTYDSSSQLLSDQGSLSAMAATTPADTMSGLQPDAVSSYGNLDYFSELTPTYSYGPSADLDAFLDELALAESADLSNQQPQFMQNLGFGPDFNPNELMNESGEWILP